MELGIGADYFVSRRFLAGLSFHYLFEPADLLGDPLNLGTNPFSFTATARFVSGDRCGFRALLAVRSLPPPHPPLLARKAAVTYRERGSCPS